MKRFSFSLLTIFITIATAFADVQIVGNNFPDNKFRIYLLNQSYGKDGVITTAEIANITEINVSSLKIQSLEGIKYFTALKTLNCDNNKLTSLDVSKNTKLTRLNCSGNQIRGAAMDALINSLPSVNSGSFHAINLSNEGNVMTASRVATAKTKGWETWYTESGTIWEKYAGAPDGIEIEERSFPDENFRLYLASHDYGKDYIISDAEIKSITYMNIDSKNVVSLQGIEYFTALESLWLFGNSINSLDVSKNASLTELYCNYNNLTKLNVTGCNALEILCCNRNKLTQIDVSGCPSLKTLRCDQNQIKGAAMDALIASLPTVSSGELWVTFNEGEENEITTIQIAAAKKKGWTAKYNDGTKWQEYAAGDIAINEDNFPDENFRNWILSQSFGEDGVLTEEEILGAKEMYVYNMDIQNMQGIEYFTALSTLECYQNKLTSIDLSKNVVLKRLVCNYNQLTSLDVSKNTALKTLYCSRNQLTSLDLSANTAIEYLQCYNNQLTSLDVSKNSKMVQLWCSDNKLTSLAIPKDAPLIYIGCYGNKLNGEAMDVIVENLPTVNNIYIQVKRNDDNEGNEMTARQVTAAKAKGWIPQCFDGTSWQEYEGSEPLKCATPTIAFVDGKLVFRCETEGVKYACNLGFETDGNNVTLPSRIKISVHAIKDGFEPSDTLTYETSLRVLLDKIGDINGDGEVGMPDIMYIVNYILNGKFPDK